MLNTPTAPTYLKNTNSRKEYSPYKNYPTKAHITSTKSYKKEYSDSLSKDFYQEPYKKSEASSKISILEGQNTSIEETFETSAFSHIKNKFLSRMDYEIDPEIYKKTFNEDFNFTTTERRKPVTSYEYQLELELKKQKEMLKLEHKVDLERQKQELLEEFQIELDIMHEKISTKLYEKQDEVLKIREKEIREAYDLDISLIQREHEAKLKIKIADIAGDYERQLHKQKEENAWLKAQNETYKRKIEELQTKAEISKVQEKRGQNYMDYENHLSDQFNEIHRQYALLQSDYLDLKKKKPDELCKKCKAFINADKELAQKISRIRAFMDSELN
jgi:hypothetical protein